jgi:thiamine transport system substrate-binding protein
VAERFEIRQTTLLDPGNAGGRTMRLIFIFILFLTQILISGQAQACELIIYTYDSIVSHGGLGSEIFPLFEKKSGCKVRVLASGDGVQALSRVELDSKRGKPGGQILLGIDQTLWARARAVQEPLSAGLKTAERLVLTKSVSEDALAGDFVPYDYGVLALMADEDHLQGQAPTSLRDLVLPVWKKKIILEDPRMSTPGLQLVLFSHEVLQSEFGEFWKMLASQWLAMPEGWDEAYSLFLKEEAPLVWSYTTSQAYHEENGSHRYRAILFSEGQPLQIESAMLIKNSFQNAEQRKLAEDFLNYLTSADVQSRIPKTNWMFPAREGTAVPDNFKTLPTAKSIFTLKNVQSSAILKEWERAVFQ